MTRPINLFEYAEIAQQHLEPMALDYYRSGAEDEITLRANRLAINRYRLRPKMLVDVSRRDFTTTILGQSLAKVFYGMTRGYFYLIFWGLKQWSAPFWLAWSKLISKAASNVWCIFFRNQ